MKRLLMSFMMLLCVSKFSYSAVEWELLNTNPKFVKEGTNYIQYTETLADGNKQSIVMTRDSNDYYDVRFLLLPPATFDDGNCWWANIFKIKLGDTEIPKNLLSLTRFPDNYRIIYLNILGTEAKELFIDSMLNGMTLTIYLKDGEVKTIFNIDNTNFREQFEKSWDDYFNYVEEKAEKVRLEEEAEANTEEKW